MSVEKETVNPDLKREREKCSFNIEELTNAWDGNATRTKKRRAFETRVFSDKRIQDEVPGEYLSHKEKYENAIRKATTLVSLLDKHAAELEGEDDLFKSKVRGGVTTAVFPDLSPLSLHSSMFVPTLRGQGTAEQQAAWLKRAVNFEIIGTYAQTELGHGTFIRGLETTATYDPKTEEFILHCPTLTAYKWWPGALAHTANYCVLMAQLITQGKNCGIQPFLVQIRDENTHMPLPGVKVGEIGAKLGFNTVNNGFLGFDNHRIPRDRMLMKNAQVLKDGTFVPSISSKMAYGTMVLVRCSIVETAAALLSQAATIAVRYAAVRRQSQIKPSEPEIQILDFFTQQHKLFIAIATAIAYRLNSAWLRNVYERVSQDLEKGNLDDLPELHSLSCCLKALSSSDCAYLVEQCRLACGGHGYMNSSSFPTMYAAATAACTYEGENTVLMLQTARSLVKEWREYKITNKARPTSAYLFDTTERKWDNTLEGIIRGFQKVASGHLKSCIAHLDQLQASGLSHEEAWNSSSVRLVALSEAHGRCVVLTTVVQQMALMAEKLSKETGAVLDKLVRMYAAYWALQKRGDLLLFTSISGSDIALLQLEYERLLAQLRPDAVGLVDAFDYRDEILRSTLGAYDGRVYERLMSEALKSPLNQEPVNQSFHKYLKPFMKSHM